MNPARAGIFYGLAAYGWWGLVPIYFHWLRPVEPLEVLAHRIVWSAAFLAIVLTASKRWSEVLRSFRTRSLVLPLFLSAALVGGNWLLFIRAVHSDAIAQASLGYFVLPLFSAVVGSLIFRERLRPMQQGAVAIACAGTALLTWETGSAPWLALALAASFGAYGMVRKKVPVDGLLGLAVESFLLAPVAAAFLAVQYWQHKEIENTTMLLKLSLSGVVTTIPLICFGQAARRLPIAMLGFMQYISPSIQLLLAVFLFDEDIQGSWWSYGLVWAALAVFSVDSILWYRASVSANDTAQKAREFV